MTITKDTVTECARYPAKRICFAGDKNAASRRPKTLENYAHGIIQWPFCRGIDRMFPFPLSPSTPPTPDHTDAVWHRFKSEEDFSTATDWCNECGALIFLYDCLDISLALSFNFNFDIRCKTNLGELEYRAKSEECREAIEEISEKMATVINRFEPLRSADFICGVPAQASKTFHLPHEIARRVSELTEMENASGQFQFGLGKKSLANLGIEGKWDELVRVGISKPATTTPPMEPISLDGRSVLLIDDKYQSGTTIQFVAAHLQQLGANKIYGLCAVKTMSDKDNT